VKRSPRTTVAAGLVLLMNLIPLHSVLTRGWPVVFVVMLFWFEALVLVVFAALKALIAPLPGPRPAVLIGKVVISGATLAFHGGLVLGYGFFLALLFGGTMTDQGIVASPDIALDVLGAMWGDNGVLVAALVIVARHLYAFATRFLARGAWRETRATDFFDEPMRRTVLLHVGIVLSGIVLLLFLPPLAAAALLIVLKTAADLHPRFLG
jgi:hypothetical protein